MHFKSMEIVWIGVDSKTLQKTTHITLLRFNHHAQHAQLRIQRLARPTARALDEKLHRTAVAHQRLHVGLQVMK